MSNSKFVMSGALVAGLAACSSTEPDHNQVVSKIGVTPTVVEGNPTCADLGYAYEGKIDYPSFAFGDTAIVNLPGGQSVTFESADDGLGLLSWSSTIGLDAVIVKAGPRANVYAYEPEATSDNDLDVPTNDGDNPAQISHLSFCFDFEVEVSKTAQTSFTRDYSWAIEKTAATTSLLLALDQVFHVAYTVVVSPTAFADSDWAVSGLVTVHNPDPTYPATLTSVIDNLSGFGPLALDCGVSFPHVLAAGESLICSYASPLPDGTTRINTASATVAEDSMVGGGSGTANVVFSPEASTVNMIDSCVDVTDSLAGDLGTVCGSDGSKTFEYTLPFSYATCGHYDVPNTATFTSTDGETGSSSANVSVDVPCEGGCTLTQGYWKTHSSFGPAPLDSAWAGKENTMFFLSGQTYYQVLQTPPANNIYYGLAHQYIAAEMNGINGADFTAIQSAFDAATAILAHYTPAQIVMLKKTSALRSEIVSLLAALDAYNQGVTGPGHCSE